MDQKEKIESFVTFWTKSWMQQQLVCGINKQQINKTKNQRMIKGWSKNWSKKQTNDKKMKWLVWFHSQ